MSSCLLLFLSDYFLLTRPNCMFLIFAKLCNFQVDILEERLKVISIHSHTCTLLFHSEASWWFDLKGPTLSAVKCLTDCFCNGPVQFSMNDFTDCFRLGRKMDFTLALRLEKHLIMYMWKFT